MISRERGYLTYPAGAIVTVFAKDIEDDPQLWEAEVDVQFKPVKFLKQHFGTLFGYAKFLLCFSLSSSTDSREKGSNI